MLKFSQSFAATREPSGSQILKHFGAFLAFLAQVDQEVFCSFDETYSAISSMGSPCQDSFPGTRGVQRGIAGG